MIIGPKKGRFRTIGKELEHRLMIIRIQKKNIKKGAFRPMERRAGRRGNRLKGLEANQLSKGTDYPGQLNMRQDSQKMTFWIRSLRKVTKKSEETTH